MQTAAPTYYPKYKSEGVHLGTGRAVICAGWTKCETLVSRLDKSEYAAIGQLYSAARGIDILIRNLLLNPQIDQLVLLEATKADKIAGSIQCLADFFGFGVEANRQGESPVWKILSKFEGYIGGDIAEDDLHFLRVTISTYRVQSVSELPAQLERINSAPPTNRTRPKKDYPPRAHLEQATLPGEQYGHLIRGSTIADTWLMVLQRVIRTGRWRQHGASTRLQELIDVLAVIESPDALAEIPDFFPVTAEYLQAYMGSALYYDESEGVSYTYGSRLRHLFGHDQVKSATLKLKQNPNSTQCAIVLWDARNDHLSSTPPCLNHIWLKINDQSLLLTATFRSHDIFGAWVANVIALSRLQAEVVKELSVGMQISAGPLIIVSQSAHVYDHAIEAATLVVDKHYDKHVLPNYADPVGNFIIECSHNEIVVTHTTVAGVAVATYKRTITPRNETFVAWQLLKEILSANPGIRNDHAAYLGVELGRAAVSREEYRQS